MHSNSESTEISTQLSTKLIYDNCIMLFVVHMTIFLAAHLFIDSYCTADGVNDYVYWLLDPHHWLLSLTYRTVLLHRILAILLCLLLPSYSMPTIFTTSWITYTVLIRLRLLPCFQECPILFPMLSSQRPVAVDFGTDLVPWSGPLCGVDWFLIIHWKPLVLFQITN